MKKTVVVVAFCLLGLSLFAQNSDVLSLQDAIALYEGKKDIETIKELVAKDINADNSDDNNYTPLMYASKNGYTEIVTVLIAEGADIDARSIRKKTALIIAAGSGHAEVVKILIAGGADIEIKDRSHWTALMLAALFGRTEIVTLLIAEGADVNAKDYYGDTVLIAAAGNGHTGIVTLLIEAGADVNATAPNGIYYTALIDAAYNGHQETVTVLIEAGADINIKNDAGNTALIYAARGGQPKVATVLIEAGADIDIKNNRGHTALMEAAYGGDRSYNEHTKVLILLIEAGADIDATDNDGETALMNSASHRKMASVETLIEAGADIELKDNSGDTALTYAFGSARKLLMEALGFYIVHGTDHNYYEVPYVGEKSRLTKLTKNAKINTIEKYNLPTTVSDFLNDGSSITGKLISVYYEDISNENGVITLSVYRLMYALSGSDSNGMTKLNFVEGDETERQSYGQAIYIITSNYTNTELFSRDIYFGNRDLSSSDNLGVIGHNTYFKVIGDTVLSVKYTLQTSSNQTDSKHHSAILYRNKTGSIQDKTELCQVKAPFPLIDTNNPYRYTIQNALDNNPATSYVENTEDDLMTIQFDFPSDHTFTDIALINGYAQSENLYYFNNRGKTIGFPETGNEARYNLDGNTLTHQEFAFENAITQSSVTMDVTEIYNGTKYTDTCLAELDIYIEGDGWLFGFE